MEDIFGKIIVILLALLLLFVAPILNTFQSQDETSRIYVLSETAKFVDEVRNIGYITPTQYQDFVNKISNTNNLYDVELVHYHLKHDPVYSDPAVPSSFQGNFNVNYSATYTKSILDTLYPSGSTGKYKMSKGDYFSVLVFNRNKTFATRIQEVLYNSPLSTKKIVINYGGVIKDEAN